MKCQYLGNEIRYEAEICYLEEQLEVIYDANSNYATEIRGKLSNMIEFDDVIILKTMKTRKCQHLGKRIKNIAEI